MKKYYSAILSCFALGAAPFADAQVIIVETRTGGQNLSWYAEAGGNWANSTLKSTAAGVTAGIGSRFATTDGAAFTVSPVLEDGAIYAVDITHGNSSNIPNDLTNSVEVTGGTGLPATTTIFSLSGFNSWERLGFLTNNSGVTTPTIKFTKLPGASGTGQRLYADAIRFTKFDPCFNGLPQLTTVNGPLAAGQLFVDVPGVSGSATAVSVYADGLRVGQKTSGIVAGVNRVDLTGSLTKNAMVVATQTDGNNIESCRPAVGTLVGGGANPSMRIALSIRQNTSEAGPIGRDGGATSTIIKFLGATGVVNNVNGNAPLGNRIFYPGNDWQTVEFLRGADPANPVDGTYMWNGTDATDPNQLKGDFGILDSIVFYLNEPDSGPFGIYIDTFMNGSTLVQGFEGVLPGGSAGFVQPSFSGTTSPYLLSPAPGTISPNVAMVTNNTADSGAHCLYASWQFKDTNNVNWLRFVAQGAGSPNPVLDLRQPISFRMLILPVGQTPAPSAPLIPAGPPDQHVIPGGSISMRVNVRGTSPFSYQWRHEGQDITGATSATLTLTNVQLSQMGAYTVFVSNSLGSQESPPGTLTVEDVPFTDVMTPAWVLTNGSRPYLANDNNTRSIAWNSYSGNLLVASRSGNSNAIYVLDGDTGAFLYTLDPPAGGFTGGTLALNQIATADDGSVYAANLTTDGATANFRLYKWYDDLQGEAGALLYDGNPANDANIHLRWGDAMTVRTVGGVNEVLVSSSGTLLAIITDFPSEATVDVTNAPATGFRLGLAAVGTPPDDFIWGKMIGLPLLRAQIDESSHIGTVVNSFSGFDTMSAIGVNPAGTLLAGVFVDSPDHLRLFDISTPGTITALDTELFPSDNANVNATGAVAFGNNKVYALDSNNGLVAMNLSTDCLPDRLTIEHDGTDVILRWSRPTYHLEGTSTIGGTWHRIDEYSPFTLNAPTGTQFFRLVCP